LHLRLLVDAPADGASNMAVDETLLESAMKPRGGATLRLYRFARPSVTFGYSQAVSDAVNETACRNLGVGWVRRITGGRALVHQHELTYSFAAPTLTRSVKSAYRIVTGAIRDALEHLGVPLDPAANADAGRAASREQSPKHLPCLAVATGHEITARGGHKLVASAMRHRRLGFVQQGSILWSVERCLWEQLTRIGPDEELPAVGIRQLVAKAPPEDQLIESLSASFASRFGTTAEPGELTAEESLRAWALTEKYRSHDWTERRQGLRLPIG
jgi:lipoate-protein ligase A